MPDVIFLTFVRNRRPGAHQGHIASQDVNELGKLVETCATQNPANRCNPRVLCHLVEFSALALGLAIVLASNNAFNELLMYLGVVIRIHRAKLKEGKWPAESTKTLLLVEDRPLGTQPDQQSNQQKHRRQKQEGACTPDQVDEPFDHACKTLIFRAMHKIWIQGWISLSCFLVPVLRKDMQRNTNLAEVPDRKSVPQRL